MPAAEALKAVAAFRLALPRTMLRFAGGREITLGDLGAKQGILGGINAVIVGNYPDHLGRPAEADLNCWRICRCRSRPSTPACDDRSPVDRGRRRRLQRLHPENPPARTSDRRPVGSGAAAVLRRVRPADDRAGAPGRMVGTVFAARTGGFPGSGDAAMTAAAPPPRRSLRFAVVSVIGDLRCAVPCWAYLWAWIALPIPHHHRADPIR